MSTDPSQPMDLLGVRCDVYASEREAINHVKASVEAGVTGYTVAINAEKFVRSQDDPEFRRIVMGARIHVPDGAGAVLALRWLLGVRSVKVDFPRATLQAANELGEYCRLGVIGASDASHRGAIERIRALYPNANIVLSRSGFTDEAELMREVADRQPQLCLVAMGTPKQELFAHRAVESGAKCLFVGCGGALDILSGHAVRAPRWMVENYLEWLYRLVQQPTRWRRQLVLPVFFWRLLLAKVRRLR